MSVCDNKNSMLMFNNQESDGRFISRAGWKTNDILLMSSVQEDCLLFEFETTCAYSYIKTQMKMSSHDITELYALCKGGNFSIHIWAWFGYFIINKGNQVLFIIW